MMKLIAAFLTLFALPAWAANPEVLAQAKAMEAEMDALKPNLLADPANRNEQLRLLGRAVKFARQSLAQDGLDNAALEAITHVLVRAVDYQQMFEVGAAYKEASRYEVQIDTILNKFARQGAFPNETIMEFRLSMGMGAKKVETDKTKKGGKSRKPQSLEQDPQIPDIDPKPGGAVKIKGASVSEDGAGLSPCVLGKGACGEAPALSPTARKAIQKTPPPPATETRKGKKADENETDFSSFIPVKEK